MADSGRRRFNANLGLDRVPPPALLVLLGAILLALGQGIVDGDYWLLLVAPLSVFGWLRIYLAARARRRT
jgi:hypothetical protein